MFIYENKHTLIGKCMYIRVCEIHLSIKIYIHLLIHIPCKGLQSRDDNLAPLPRDDTTREISYRV